MLVVTSVDDASRTSMHYANCDVNRCCVVDVLVVTSLHVDCRDITIKFLLLILFFKCELNQNNNTTSFIGMMNFESKINFSESLCFSILYYFHIRESIRFHNSRRQNYIYLSKDQFLHNSCNFSAKKNQFFPVQLKIMKQDWLNCVFRRDNYSCSAVYFLTMWQNWRRTWSCWYLSLGLRIYYIRKFLERDCVFERYNYLYSAVGLLPMWPMRGNHK